jgi:hypothetical protein
MRDPSDESVARLYHEGARNKRGHLVSPKRWRTSSFTQGKYPQNIYSLEVINLLLSLDDVCLNGITNCSYTLTDVALHTLCLSCNFLLVGRFSPVLS